MDTWQIALLAAYGLVLAAVLTRHFMCRRELRRAPRLTRHSRKSGGGFPFVSVIVPARNEAANIEWCVRSLLEQDYPHFEVLVVDDRSDDQTAAIVEGLCREDGRLRLLRVRDLPAGWTGKAHALHAGQAAARGEWLLFVDADTTHHPACLSVLMREALDGQADYVSLLPALECCTFWQRVVQPVAASCRMLLDPLSQANDPCRQRGVADSQFLLIRRVAYDAVEGFEAVRDQHLDDMHLGRRVRNAGGRLRVALGADVGSVRRDSSLAVLVQDWSHVLTAAVDRRPGGLYVLAATLCLCDLLPCFVIGASGLALAAGLDAAWMRALFGMGVVHELLQLALYASLFSATGSRRRYLAFRWLAVGAMLTILWRAIGLCHAPEVTWRDTGSGHSPQPQLPVQQPPWHQEAA